MTKPVSVMGGMKYRTIVADPPWHYDGFAHAGPNHWKAADAFGNRPRRTNEERGPIKTVPLPYPSLSTEDIAALPVADLADDDARLFLWATTRYLPAALTIGANWGFDYKQTLVWDKTPFFNPLGGSVAPNACEFLLVFVKGSPARIGRWSSSAVRARKARNTHSRKPDVFLDLVETVSPGPYIELFARSQRLGWDTWGDEALAHVEMAS